MRLGLSSLLLICGTVDLAVAVGWGGGVCAAASDAMAPPCQTSITASAPLPQAAPADGLRLQVCRNEDCAAYDLAGAPLAFTAATACDGACYVGDGVVQVSQPLPPPAQLSPTDTYDVRLFDPLTQRSYAASHGHVRYATGECRSAEVSAGPLFGS
jgi:hypothetical protein